MTEACVYLPSYDTVTIWHLKELSNGSKKVSFDTVNIVFYLIQAIHCDDVKVIAVPQYEGMSLDDIMDFGLGYKDVVDSLPVLREIRKMPRAYICNVIYTRVG